MTQILTGKRWKRLCWSGASAAQGPTASLRVIGAVPPEEDTDMDAVRSLTHILERDLALNRDLQSLRSFNLPISQGVASYMGNTEDGLEAANPQPANPQSVGQVDSLAGQAQFQCIECKKSFLYKSHFDLHQKSHTEERVQLVQQGIFLQSSDLGVHQRVHTGEKPHTRAVCRKEFSQQVHPAGPPQSSPHEGEALCV